MPIEISDNEEISQLEVGARLLAHAILLPPEEARNSFFGTEAICITHFGRWLIPIPTISPWTLEEFFLLNRLFSFSGVREAAQHGLYGTSVRLNSERRFCIGLYASSDGAMLFRDLMANFRPSKRPPIEIIEVGQITFSQAISSQGGESVGPRPGSVTGTLGGWLRTGQPDKLIGISNNHILTEFDRFGINTEVLQPGGGRGHVVGTVDGVVKLNTHDPRNPFTTTNVVDLAWCIPDPSTTTRCEIGPTNVIPVGEADWIGELLQNQMPIPVQCFGMRSGEAYGSVTAIRSFLWLIEPNNPNGQFVFEDQLQITLDKVQQGDSGSLIMSEPGLLIGGLLFAFDPNRSGVAFACPWQCVRKMSNLDFQY